LKEAGRSQEADEALDLMLKLPDQRLVYEAHGLRAEWLQNSGDLKRASEEDRKQIDPAQASPDWASFGRQLLAQVLMAMGDKTGAAAVTKELADSIRETARKAPDDYWAVVELGNLCYSQGDVKGAAAAYRDAICLDPTTSYAYWGLTWA